MDKEQESPKNPIQCDKAPLGKHNFAAGVCSWCDAPQETGRKKGVRELRSIAD